ncbi:MAG: hypothetical protein KDK99_05330 [Verrucomicrobiales bacterium]|nr:hypothetical protein [Verrucomicrobiales bacterium]
MHVPTFLRWTAATLGLGVWMMVSVGAQDAAPATAGEEAVPTLGNLPDGKPEAKPDGKADAETDGKPDGKKLEDLEPEAPREPLKGPLSQEQLIRELTAVQSLQARQRYVDALQRLDEIERVNPSVADIYNIRGSILLAPNLRDFDRAEEQFRKAARLRPDMVAADFNLAELFFVKHDWATATKGFAQVMEKFPKLPESVRHLVIFKQVLCALKLDQPKVAEKLVEENFTFMDNTPAYYFSQAAMAFAADKVSKAQEWLAKAGTIFKQADNLAYLDSLMEARWVPNIGLPPVDDAAGGQP